MSEQLPGAPPTGEPIAYQPISGWAIAGFAAGALFAVLVAISTIVALTQGVPLFFPIWIVGLAVAGVVLSLMGQSHVRNSEGTRAGAKLARIGMWLSLIGGLSYLSYYFFTGFALQRQAHVFLTEKIDDESGFFPLLREGATDSVKLNTAFLLTLPANQRSGRPDNEASMAKLYDIGGKDGNPGNLSHFKYGMSPALQGTLTRIFFKQNAKDVKITELGVQEWKYEQKSYQVARNYRLETKELEMDMTLWVFSTEAETAGQGRKWYLNLNASGVTNKTLTPFGEGLRALRHSAHGSLLQWIAALNNGASYSLVKEHDQTDWELKGGDGLEKRDLIYQLFRSDLKNRITDFRVHARGDEVGKWEEMPDGKIRIYHSFRFGLPREPGKPALYLVDAYTVHETVRAVNPVEVNPQAPTDWQLVQIFFIDVLPMPELKNKGPG